MTSLKKKVELKKYAQGLFQKSNLKLTRLYIKNWKSSICWGDEAQLLLLRVRTASGAFFNVKQLKCLNRQKTAKYRREDNYYVLYTTSTYEKQERTHLKKAYIYNYDNGT